MCNLFGIWANNSDKTRSRWSSEQQSECCITTLVSIREQKNVNRIIVASILMRTETTFVCRMFTIAHYVCCILTCNKWKWDRHPIQTPEDGSPFKPIIVKRSLISLPNFYWTLELVNRLSNTELLRLPGEFYIRNNIPITSWRTCRSAPPGSMVTALVLSLLKIVSLGRPYVIETMY